MTYATTDKRGTPVNNGDKVWFRNILYKVYSVQPCGAVILEGVWEKCKRKTVSPKWILNDRQPHDHR